jgi:hypothetical protein
MHLNLSRRVLLARLSLGYFPMALAQQAIAAEKQTSEPAGTKKWVNDERGLYSAIANANKLGGQTTVELAPGIYRLDSTLQLIANGIVLKGMGITASDVTISGEAMSEDAKIKNLIRISGSSCGLVNLRLAKAGWHLVQVVGEFGAKNLVFLNCIFEDSWQQLLKITKGVGDSKTKNGRIQACVFRYSNGVGPQWYIGGIDAHGAENWTVTDNVFTGIASPSRKIAQHAIHFWSDSSNNIVERNLILNCDRGIGFGLKGSPNVGGIIRNNLISHLTNKHPFSDASIVAEDCVGSAIYHNTCIVSHDYPHAIECRGRTTKDVSVRNNLTNRPIKAIQNPIFRMSGNVETKFLSAFTKSNEHLDAISKTPFKETLLLDEVDKITDRKSDYSRKNISQFARHFAGAIDLNQVR